MTVELPGVPGPLRWLAEPARHTVDGADLTLHAPAQTDRFTDPAGGPRADNAPALVADMTGVGDYQLAARVTVDFNGDFDAGVLLLWAGNDSYAKLCFEYSPQGQPMAVSVVTRGVSDDANGFPIEGNSAWLRVARTGRSFAFHASTDGVLWQFVRHFDLGADREPEVGFQAQAPAGSGCTARFTDISFLRATLADLRDGG